MRETFSPKVALPHFDLHLFTLFGLLGFGLVLALTLSISLVILMNLEIIVDLDEFLCTDEKLSESFWLFTNH